MKFKIIGISGLARVGKDTAAGFIQDNIEGYERASFADPIKEMLMIGLGMSAEQMYGGEVREKIDPRYGCTPRHLMQTLGTEWGRDIIDQNIWVNAMKSKLGTIEGGLIIPDVRFESEAEFIRKNGVLIHIKGKTTLSSTHKSESGVYIEPEDITVLNNDTIYLFQSAIKKVCNIYLK